MSNPIDILPIEHPIRVDPSVGELDYFYENVSKHLIEDVIKIMGNGIPIDLTKVAELETTVTNVLEDVTTRLASNSVIQDFQAFMYPKKFKAFKDELELRKRPIDYYIKDYKATVVHRTYAVDAYLKSIGSEHYKRPNSWTIKAIKGLNILLEDTVLSDFILGKSIPTWEKEGMYNLAAEKHRVYNKSIDSKIKEKGTQENLLPPFNPASSTQKKELFDWLGVEALSTSKTSGEASFPRSDLEIMLKTESREEVKEVLQAFIDHSFSAIIKNNFIAGFKQNTIDGILYGNLKLFGAKSFRLTSSS